MSNPDYVVMYGKVKLFALFLVILIVMALFVLVALWMMITLNPGSQSGAVFILFDQIGSFTTGVMVLLSGTVAWLIDRFWSFVG
jgi:hypothetical protein